MLGDKLAMGWTLANKNGFFRGQGCGVKYREF